MDFNIYYQGEKINKECISENDLKNIMSRNYIFKRNEDSKMQKINTKNIEVRKCTII